MHKKLKSEKGVTLISLVVTIVVMMILVISITSSLSTTTELKRFNEVKEDIVTLTEEVKVYYLNNGTLPIDTSTKIALNISSDMKNVNDGGNYYPIKTDLLDVELNNGEGNKQKNYTTTDLYVVDDVSLTVYYVNGITINGITYYTLTDDFVAGNYTKYTKTDLPIVASVTMQSNGSNKNKVTLGDKVTLRIITNYELTQTPTVKINNTEVTVTWNGTIGTASYTISADSGLSAGDEISINISGQQVDGRVEGAITDVTFGKGVYYYVADSKVEGVTIPSGYYYVGGTKAKGIVISDNIADKELDKGKEDVRRDLAGNQWVWVPVETPSSLYTTVDAGQALAGSTGVKTTKYTNSAIISGITRGLPGSTNWREPDLVLGSDGKQYDYANYAKAGFSSLANMAENMKSDHEEMIASLEKYKGFYIGRYELSANGEKTGATQTNVNWYTLYKNCTTLASGTKVKTRMIWGLQWDATCNWLASSGFSITDSSTWGNYSNNTAGGHGSKQNTGYSESWKANNIYDFAGNCWEFIQEAGSAYGRAYRGGNFNYGTGSDSPASVRCNISPTSADSISGSRPTLYLIP